MTQIDPIAISFNLLINIIPIKLELIEIPTILINLNNIFINLIYFII